MKKIFLIIFFLFVTSNLFANTAEYKGLEKLSKNNTFMDDKGKPYSIEEISDKKNSLVIIYNHGSIQDNKQDPCKAKPQYGYIWDAAVLGIANAGMREICHDDIHRLCCSEPFAAWRGRDMGRG